MSRRRLAVVAGVVAIVVLAVGALAGGYAVTSAVRGSSATPSPTLPSAYRAAQRPPARPAPNRPAPMPTPGGVRRALGALLRAPGLGGHLRGRVVDAGSGTVLFDQDSATPGAPASTAKLLTAAAVLAVRAPTDRITTRVVAGGGGRIVLVGGGDPTLTGARPGAPAAYPGAARLADLAAQVRRAGVPVRSVVVDDALFSGPAVNPAWAPEDVPSDYASAITALLADGGRPTPGAEIRSAAPDLAAGREFAALLGHPTLAVSRGAAPAGARVLGSVQSAPYSVLVGQMLQESDNVIAECLGRQVALAEHQPASFTGAARGIRIALRGLGVDPGAGMVDGSGLAAGDRLSVATLAAVLRLVARGDRPALHAVVAALPVAAWSGTLADRYVSGAARAGAGVVRAKTGTLTGVSTLAGTVHDRAGRLLVFAFLADRATGTAPAESALDDLAARLAACGCR